MNIRRGQWVVQHTVSQPSFGCVVDVYEDALEPGKWLVDVGVYDKDGNRIGRRSPACGGPTTFEPALPADTLELIQKPVCWPLKCDLYGCWSDSLKRI